MSEQMKTTPETVTVVDIQFRPGQKVYYFDPAGLVCKAGDHVIIDTARGAEYGYCTAGNHKISAKDIVAPLRPVLRLANEQDEKIAEENRTKEKKAFQRCMELIQEQALDMQLVSAECAFDGSKILFFFTADERVDFRELVKSLASAFHSRIELRQIGVRDKAKMVGGLGICGRPFCCASFLDDFQPVSIKMAKTQNLSLSPTKISGTCGRLMCCLKYEQDAYEDLLRTSPKAESFVDTPDGRGTVVEVDLLRQRVKVKMENEPDVIAYYANADIAVLRNGKAKKNDPPIPDDLAPISGGKKAKKKEFSFSDTPRFLDPIRFRYSEETVAEEQELATEGISEESSDAKEAIRQNRNRRNRRRPVKAAQPAGNGEAKKPEVQKKANAEVAETPKLEQKSGDGQTKKRRRPPHRRSHKPTPSGGENA